MPNDWLLATSSQDLREYEGSLDDPLIEYELQIPIKDLVVEARTEG